jgi:hypothetical protein
MVADQDRIPEIVYRARAVPFGIAAVRLQAERDITDFFATRPGRVGDGKIQSLRGRSLP